MRLQEGLERWEEEEEPWGSALGPFPIPVLTSRWPQPGTGGGPNLEVGLLEDAGQLGCGAALLRQLRQVPQDFLHQLQVVVPHCLQLRLLQPLMGLGVGWSR